MELEHPIYVGDGTISIGCRQCGYDGEYGTAEFHLKIADTDLPSLYNPRVEPSAMPRQPLLRTKHRDSFPKFGKHALEDRPKAGALIARIISLSSEVDIATAYVMRSMMNAHSAPAVALFLSLRQSRVQFDVLDAVAKVVLVEERDYDLFGALMSLRSAVDRERDALAHGRFAETPAIPDGIVWVDSFDYLQPEMRVRDYNKEPNEVRRWLRERMYVYELGDLERIARDSAALQDSLMWFSDYLDEAEAAQREAKYLRLCAKPHVQQALVQLLAGKKNKP